ncbi:MAG: type II secretion system protein [Synergistaceae bacterium]|nr:type II secretion system protein [Synergistaceae bacterium]
MKRTRKGFTLIELLIVVAILSSLAAMFGLASSDSVNSAKAASVVANLKVMKTAAMALYIDDPIIDTGVEQKSISNYTMPNAETDLGRAVLAEYMGTTSEALWKAGYRFVGTPEAWYVCYFINADVINASVKEKWQAMSADAALYGASSLAADKPFGFSALYKTTDKFIGMKVR